MLLFIIIPQASPVSMCRLRPPNHPPIQKNPPPRSIALLCPQVRPHLEAGARNLDSFLSDLKELQALLAYLAAHSTLASARDAHGAAQAVLQTALEQCAAVRS